MFKRIDWQTGAGFLTVVTTVSGFLTWVASRIPDMSGFEWPYFVILFFVFFAAGVIIWSLWAIAYRLYKGPPAHPSPQAVNSQAADPPTLTERLIMQRLDKMERLDLESLAANRKNMSQRLETLENLVRSGSIHLFFNYQVGQFRLKVIRELLEQYPGDRDLSLQFLEQWFDWRRADHVPNTLTTQLGYEYKHRLAEEIARTKKTIYNNALFVTLQPGDQFTSPAEKQRYHLLKAQYEATRTYLARVEKQLESEQKHIEQEVLTIFATPPSAAAQMVAGENEDQELRKIEASRTDAQ